MLDEAHQLKLELPCDLRFRDAGGAVILKVCQRMERHGAPSGLGYQVLSAFNEAFNNVVQFGGSKRPVEVLLRLNPGEVVLEMLDQGLGFALDEVAEPDLDELPESGLGIHIMRSCMSEVSYEPGELGRKNRLRMSRRYDLPEG